MLPPRSTIPIDTRTVASFDGAAVTYHLTPAPEGGAPWIVLAGGLGTTIALFRGQIEYLRGSHRFLTWDYRGLAPAAAAPFAIDAHARDLAAILAAERFYRDHGFSADGERPRPAR